MFACEIGRVLEFVACCLLVLFAVAVVAGGAVAVAVAVSVAAAVAVGVADVAAVCWCISRCSCCCYCSRRIERQIRSSWSLVPVLRNLYSIGLYNE